MAYKDPEYMKKWRAANAGKLQPCNRALGMFKDSRPILDRASAYLKKFEPK